MKYIFFHLLIIGAFLVLIPIPVSAEYIPTLNPDYGSFQQEGNYLHVRTGFACETSSLTVGFTNLLSNVASDVSAEGVIQDNDGEYIDFDPPISSGVWYFNISNLYSGFDTVYPISYFEGLWPNRTAYKAVLDCNTGESTVRSWFIFQSSDQGSLIFGIALLIFFVSLWFWAYIYNNIFKRAK